MPKPVWLICLSLLTLSRAEAQTFDFPAAAAEDPAALSQALPGLARAVLDVYREDDRRSGRLTSRRFQPGSRLVVLLRIPKSPGAQINYGTGKDVSDETIADAREPLEIRWLGDSFLDVPIRR